MPSIPGKHNQVLRRDCYSGVAVVSADDPWCLLYAWSSSQLVGWTVTALVTQQKSADHRSLFCDSSAAEENSGVLPTSALAGRERLPAARSSQAKQAIDGLAAGCPFPSGNRSV